MTGQHIQDLMKQEGYSVNEMAKMIGKAQQVLASALKHDDIRTGLLEDIAQAMGKPLSFFYGETFGSVANITGNHNATATGSNNTVTTNDDRLLTLLLNKDEQLTLAMKQTSKAQEQVDKAQNQIDRVLDKFLGSTENR
jgi:transcriptional regulator with XRE-family HTH domain